MSSECTYPARLGMTSSTETVMVHWKAFQSQRSLSLFAMINVRLPWLHTASHGRPPYRLSVSLYLRSTITNRKANQTGAKGTNHTLQHNNTKAPQVTRTTTPTSPTPSPSSRAIATHIAERHLAKSNQPTCHAMPLSQPSPARAPPPPLLIRTHDQRDQGTDTEPLTGTGRMRNAQSH
jgi:hypothetical protein